MSQNNNNSNKKSKKRKFIEFDQSSEQIEETKNGEKENKEANSKLDIFKKRKIGKPDQTLSSFDVEELDLSGVLQNSDQNSASFDSVKFDSKYAS